MKVSRTALLAAATLLLVALLGCELVSDPRGEEMAKDASAIATADYTPTQPLQASYAGTTAGAPTWNRLETNGALSLTGTDVPYHVEPFEVSLAGSYSVYSYQAFDGYLLLYGGGFDPAYPQTGFLAASDDNPATGESLVTLALEAGVSYQIVTTGYDNYSYGFFVNSIYGPGTVTGPGTLQKVDYTASTIGAATWTRLEADGTPSDVVVPYHAQDFVVTAAGTYYVRSVQDYDGYLHLYAGGFDPTDPTTGFVVGNDDALHVGTSLVVADLEPSTTYTVVTSGWSGYQYGLFTNSIVGPSAAQLLGDDTTPPVVTLYLNGVEAVDDSVWYTTSVTSSWDMSDPESVVSILAGCQPQTYMTDTTGTALTCSVSSLGGATSASFDLKLDQAPPTVIVTGVEDGATYELGSVPTAGCETTDATSGVAVAATLELSGGPTGTVVASCQGALDNAGNIGGNSAEYFVREPLDPTEATYELIDDVQVLRDDGVLNAGQANGLIRPLENVLRSLDKDKTLDACNQLDDFIVEVEAKVPPLNEAQASELIASAEAIQEKLGCE